MFQEFCIQIYLHYRDRGLKERQIRKDGRVSESVIKSSAAAKGGLWGGGVVMVIISMMGG